jgi:hypothetical protein
MKILFTITTYLALDRKFDEVNCALETFFKFENTNKIKKYLLINEYHEKDTSHLLNQIKKKFPKLIIYQKKENEKGQVFSLNIIIKLLKLGDFNYWIQWEEGWFVNQSFIQNGINIIHNENLDQLQFSYMDWHDQDNKIKKNGYYLIPSRGNNYYDNAKSNNERTGKWPLFSLRPSINRVSKILEIGYFKKNSPNEMWTQKFEYDYSYKFMEKKGIKGSIIGDYVFRNKNHYSTY